MRALYLSLVCWLFTASATAADRLPVEAFGSLPDTSQMVLSPDGYRMASLSRLDRDGMSGSLIGVYDTRTQKHASLLRSDNKKFIVNYIRWANDHLLLVSARFPADRYGTPTTETRLLKIDIDTNAIDVVIPDNMIRSFRWIPQFQDHIVDILPNDPDNILLALDPFKPGEVRVYRVNLESGRMKVVHNSRPHVSQWIADRQHNIRVGVYQYDGELKILTRSAASGDWTTRWKFNAFDEEAIVPLGFGLDPDVLYVRSYHDGRKAIFKVDLRDEASDLKLVFSDPEFDVDGGLIFSRNRGDVVGISYANGGGYTFWDEELKGLQKSIDAILPDTTNYVYGFSDDLKRYLMLAMSDTVPGTYYFGDRDNHTLSPVTDRYSQLNPAQMSKKNHVAYQARDGLTINGYLTLPKNSSGGDLPAIIFPHGGPISFDDGGFDYWTQFFVNRGYAVLQMNFRGSSGYGYDFMKAGIQGWGLEMQDDVEDGARWLVEQGVADPDRMCIVGASYGGYVALMGAVKTPDLYQCAISFAGVSDVEAQVKSHRRFVNYEIVKEQVGDNFKALRTRSPINFAEQVKVPVLLIHGTEDRSVKVDQSQDMNRALLKAGKQVTYVELEDGDHHLSDNALRLQTFRAMDEFLNRYLPVTIN